MSKYIYVDVYAEIDVIRIGLSPFLQQNSGVYSASQP